MIDVHCHVLQVYRNDERKNEPEGKHGSQDLDEAWRTQMGQATRNGVKKIIGVTETVEEVEMVLSMLANHTKAKNAAAPKWEGFQSLVAPLSHDKLALTQNIIRKSQGDETIGFGVEESKTEVLFCLGLHPEHVCKGGLHRILRSIEVGRINNAIVGVGEIGLCIVLTKLI